MNYYLEPHTHTLYVYHNNMLIATLPDVQESSAYMLADEVHDSWKEQYIANWGIIPLTNQPKYVIL